MTAAPRTPITHVVLSGGVGGAKLVAGLYQLGAPDELCVVANTGDDFQHLGLHISPDLDTLMYTLAGIANPDTGWGIENETWNFMAALDALDGETWFRLGDRDLATHVERTRLLASGRSLSEVTAELYQRWGITAQVVPMTDDPVATMIESDEGLLGFQEYFVRRQAQPIVAGFRYQGSKAAAGNVTALRALSEPTLKTVLITPSNPFLSIDPILALGDISSAVRSAKVPIVAISPIVGGEAIKGPTAKIMNELGQDVSAVGVAQHYREIIDGIVIDERDADCVDAISDLGIQVACAQTIMRDTDDKIALANFVIQFAQQIEKIQADNIDVGSRSN